MPTIATREFCALCHRVSPVGFWVPNHVWREVVHPSRVNDILCPACFIARADEKMIDWDSQIKFFPVSLHTHLGRLEK